MSRSLKVAGLALVSAISFAALGAAQHGHQQQAPGGATRPAAAAAPAPAAVVTPAAPAANSSAVGAAPAAAVPAAAGPRVMPSDTPRFAQRSYGVGRPATATEIAGWDIDVRPDGQGLRPGRGTVKQGEELYLAQCASCHGDFGESAGRWPVLAGGHGSLNTHDPVKTVGSYWPYVSTLIDYIHRAMPFGNAQSLTWDETYAIAAYVLYVNDVITDETFELNERNAVTLRLPNEKNFVPDDRETAEASFWRAEPCMTNCATGAPRIVGRARSVDVTPDAKERPRTD